jgi:photosystem II stability/assembly factor-like uncharacterized protein
MKTRFLAALTLAALPSILARAQEPEAELDALRAKVAALEARLGLAEQGRPTPAAARLGWYADHRALAEASPYRDLRWQFLGPTNISGRVTDLAVAAPRGRTYTMYVATASGGVWKTVNEGTTWTPVFEHAASTSIGDVTLAPSDPETVWVGTGEANIFRSSFAGAGVHKSVDGGRTFAHMGLADTLTIARIVVHPTDPDRVWVAASGHEWSDNEERGVYRTRDGGRTWERCLFVDERTGAIDLVIAPDDPETLYAATWQRIRRRWNDPRNEPGYGGSGIHRSTDGGTTWTPIVAGLPAAADRGRIGLDVCRSRPEVLYAFVDNYELHAEAGEGTDSYGRPRGAVIKGATLYRSDDRGDSWRQVSADDAYMRGLSSTYGWVFGQVRVDPSDPEVVYLMGLALHVSRDGGRTFERLGGMHGDHHALWIDPDNPRYLVNGNDGGANLSYDGGRTWKLFTDGIPAVQFFNVAFDMAEPFHVYGSIQDHGSRRAVVDLSRGRDRIPAQAWEGAPGGEGSHHAIDPTDPGTVYSCGFYGRITRTDLATGERIALLPPTARGDEPLRGQWLAPMILSPHNPRILYHGMNVVLRSLDRGAGLAPISPDLTWNDRATMGDIPFHTITALAESHQRFGELYAGTDDGRVHVTRDGGGSWSEIGAGLRPHRWIARIETSRFAAGTVYLAQNGKRHDDFAPYLWRSTDHGQTWESIVANIPSGPIHVVREDPKHPEILYVGTDLGVYVTNDGARSWQSLPGGLPTTFVSDLVVHPRDDVMVISTHGRGMYALDVRPIRGEEGAPAAPAERPRRRPRGDGGPATPTGPR